MKYTIHFVIIQNRASTTATSPRMYRVHCNLKKIATMIIWIFVYLAYTFPKY